MAWERAQRDVRERGALPVPHKLRNAPTALMKASGYGEGYRYPHDEGGFAAGETYLPDALLGRRYYEPKNVGIEARIREHVLKLRGDNARAVSERSGEGENASGSTKPARDDGADDQSK